MRRTTAAPATRWCSVGPTGSAVAGAAHGDAGARDYLATTTPRSSSAVTWPAAPTSTPELSRLLSPTAQCGVSNLCPGIRVGWQSQPFPHNR